MAEGILSWTLSSTQQSSVSILVAWLLAPPQTIPTLLLHLLNKVYFIVGYVELCLPVYVPGIVCSGKPQRYSGRLQCRTGYITVVT